MTGPTADGPHHVGGSYTRAVVSYLRDSLGESGLHKVLRRAGEQRSAALLRDDLSWSTYAQFRALLEAAADALGGPHSLAPAGRLVFDPTDVVLNPMVQRLGTPEALLANAGAASAAICPIVRLEPCEVGEREWLMTQRYADGFEPYEEYCALQIGLQQVSTAIFGFPLATVVEEQCACRGASACVFRISWESTDELARRAAFLESRVETLENQLEKFTHTVSDLVSVQDLPTVLAKTFRTASQAVRAPIFLLALDNAPGTVDPIHVDGASDVEARAIAAAVQAGGEADRADRASAEIRSARAHYGFLIAVRPGSSFLSQEQTRLRAYAGFIAAALDSAIAIEDARRQEAEARRQSDTARALLELSTALAEITSIEDMADKLVRAIPAVMGSERALVLLPDADGTHARAVATYGYPEQFHADITRRRLPIVERPAGEPEFKDVADLDPNSITYRMMKDVGSVASLLLPVHVDGEWAATIVASVTGDAARYRVDPANPDRLRGLAAQAATAIRNARLLDQVRFQSLHDPLTGLPNRALILDRADQMLARARRQDNTAAALFLDLDGFKEINDTFGHAVGDALLQAATTRLAAVVRRTDTVGRLGGDEFVVLVDGSDQEAGPELIAERLLAALREPFLLAAHPVGALSVTASIGIATGDRRTAGELLRDADVALYEAKAAGKDRFAVFEDHMHAVVHDRLLLQMDLRSALERGQFTLEYQPICQLNSRRITGVEALLRWSHPERGQVAPAEFIGLLESSGQILEVGRWVLHEACRQAVRWQQAGAQLDIAVNVSGRQVQTGTFVTDVIEALTLSSLPPERLVIEITESTMMADVTSTAATLREVRRLGVRVAIDDFGTGYSSLAALRDFPVDTLKIDRAFVAGLGQGPQAAAMVRSLIQLSKSLGLVTVAEGIEHTGQYDRLESEHCEAGQGFLIARPMTASALESFLAAANTRPASSPPA